MEATVIEPNLTRIPNRCAVAFHRTSCAIATGCDGYSAKLLEPCRPVAKASTMRARQAALES